MNSRLPTIRYPDDSRYEGMMRAGKKEGRGTSFFPNGATYEGRFRADKIDGVNKKKTARFRSFSIGLICCQMLFINIAMLRHADGYSLHDENCGCGGSY